MKRILVIEDMEAVRDVTIEILRFEGFDAYGAENGTVGLQLARQMKPDLVVCDVMMPEMDGYETLEHMRSDPQLAEIPFIFLTALAAKENMRNAMNLGADDYLTKPFTTAELVTAVKSRLDRQQAIKERYIVAIKKTEEQLTHKTYYDDLTDLPNRMMLEQKLAEMLSTQRVGILIVALDRFRTVTDALGFTSSNGVLKTIADRLRVYTNPRTQLFALEREEFALLVDSPKNQEELTFLAQLLLNTIKKSISWQNHELHMTGSLGLYLSEGTTATSNDVLLNNAHAAMLKARQDGGNSYCAYMPSLDNKAFYRLSLEGLLYKALEQKELLLYYQPQIDIASRQTIGMEALLRWKNPELGLVTPAEFIPIAEENGLIIPIGEWVLQQACAHIVEINSQSSKPLKVAVNVSGRQFEQSDIVQTIQKALVQHHLNPEWLEIEITESTIIKNVEKTIMTLQAIKQMGVTVAIDDFGTGYSSLAYLKRFPLDVLKIDQSFVRNLTTDPDSASIAIAVITMAHSLGLKVTAEGIEKEEQLDFLRSYECNKAQGFYFSKPLELQDLFRYLKTA